MVVAVVALINAYRLGYNERMKHFLRRHFPVRPVRTVFTTKSWDKITKRTGAYTSKVRTTISLTDGKIVSHRQKQYLVGEA